MLKIAFPSNDGETIAAPFGKARYYVIADVEADGPYTFEQREKPPYDPGDPPRLPGVEAVRDMLGPLADCQVLICNGVGRPVFDAAVAAGIQVVLTRVTSIRSTLEAYRAGKLITDPALIHMNSSSASEAEDV